MYLIAGLGNPGTRYNLTRHNAGFLIIDRLSEELGCKLKKTSELWDGNYTSIREKKVYLMKPMTYMNRSGEAISRFEHLHRKELQGMLVISDDINLPLGTIRVRPGGSDGGHNGLKDIIFCLGNDDFPRMRVGIGRDELKAENYVDFVLGNFTDEEYNIFQTLMPVYTACIKDYVSLGIQFVMNYYNKSHIPVP